MYTPKLMWRLTKPGCGNSRDSGAAWTKALVRLASHLDIQFLHTARRAQHDCVALARFDQRARNVRNPADLARQRLGFVHADDGDGLLRAVLIGVGHRSAKENLITISLGGG